MKFENKTLDEVLDVITGMNLRVDGQVPLTDWNEEHYKILQQDGDWIGDVYKNRSEKGIEVYGPPLMLEQLK